MKTKRFGTGDGVSMVGGEWSAPDASLEAALVALASGNKAPEPIPAIARDAAWQWPPLDAEDFAHAA